MLMGPFDYAKKAFVLGFQSITALMAWIFKGVKKFFKLFRRGPEPIDLFPAPKILTGEALLREKRSIERARAELKNYHEAKLKKLREEIRILDEKERLEPKPFLQKAMSNRNLIQPEIVDAPCPMPVVDPFSRSCL